MRLKNEDQPQSVAARVNASSCPATVQVTGVQVTGVQVTGVQVTGVQVTGVQVTGQIRTWFTPATGRPGFQVCADGSAGG